MDLQKLMEKMYPFIKVIDTSLELLNQLTITIAEVPAPPFQEAERAKTVSKLFLEFGYFTFIDKVGNVLASKRENTIISDPVLISAHLDTVFSNTEIKVIQEGTRYLAPGVGDDSRGLACLLLLAKTLFETDWVDDIIFVATVGEEGRGDLRGVKHLFSKAYNWSPKIFVTIDGTNARRIVDQGIGSLRFRVHFKGPGGHSFGSFGTVNPSYAIGAFMNQFPDLQTAPNVISTYSIGVIGGGTSINAIPEEVWVDIDLRSESPVDLESMHSQLKIFAENAVIKEMGKRTGSIEVEFEIVGNRPAGRLENEGIRNIIEAVHRTMDLELEFAASSTDANVPMSFNIPAISVAGVQSSGRAHTQDEWIDVTEESLVPVVRNLVLLISLVEYYRQ